MKTTKKLEDLIIEIYFLLDSGASDEDIVHDIDLIVSPVVNGFKQDEAI